jgi:hypothetical protein
VARLEQIALRRPPEGAGELLRGGHDRMHRRPR